MGQFYDGKKHGAGVILHENGNIYDGNWANGKMEGHGVFFDKKTSAYYDGIWNSNELNGNCKVKYSKKHFFYGEFVKSKKHGRGVEFC